MTSASQILFSGRGPKPKRVFYCWEIGQDFGHIGRFVPIAVKLRQGGIAISNAVTDLSRTSFLSLGPDERVYQAPTCTVQRYVFTGVACSV